MAGMHTMGKHRHFSPCDQKGANHATRRAPHRPLNQENVLVWKQHSFLSAFMGELHTRAYHPEPCMSASPGSVPLRSTTAFSPPAAIPSPLFLDFDWPLLIWNRINGEKRSLSLSLSSCLKTTRIATSLAICWDHSPPVRLLNQQLYIDFYIL